MKKWYNIAFVAVCAVVLVVLLKAPPVKTARTPLDETHKTPKVYEGCPTCHVPGGKGPEMIADHYTKSGELRPDHVKCYMCHKPAEK